MFSKLQKCFTIFKKLFLTETEMQILAETQIPQDLTLRRIARLNRVLCPRYVRRKQRSL